MTKRRCYWHRCIQLLTSYEQALQGTALIKKLVALDDWDHIYAIARRDIPIHSKKITRIHLDLDNKQVPTWQTADLEQVPRMITSRISQQSTGMSPAEFTRLRWAKPEGWLIVQEIQQKLSSANAKSVTNVFHLAFGGLPPCLPFQKRP